MRKWLALCLGICLSAFIVAPAFADRDDDDDHYRRHRRADATNPQRGGEIHFVLDICGDDGPAGALVYIPGHSFLVKLGPSGEGKMYYVPKGTYNLNVEVDGTVIDVINGVTVKRKRVTDLGVVPVCPDLDNDGFDQSTDCDDTNPNINPSAAEACDGVDNNCDGEVDEGCVVCTDSDDDGFFAQQGCGTAVDCDDAEPTVNPAADEFCGDGIDNNCDGQVDENCPTCTPGDSCGNNIGECVSEFDAECNCIEVVPAMDEICDGLDNDCNGQTDDGIAPAPVPNGQLICNGGQLELVCDPGSENCAGECIDTNSDPANCGQCGNTCGQNETCNNGSCESTLTCAQILCAPGFTCEETPQGPVCVCQTTGQACDGSDGDLCENGTVNDQCVCQGDVEVVEVCDGIDNDCDGQTDEGIEPIPAPNGTLVCNNSQLELVCNGSFVNCDEETPNGCEIDTASDVAHCGECHNRCPAGNRCEASACVPCNEGDSIELCGGVCPAGLVNCDGFCIDGAKEGVCVIEGVCVSEGTPHPTLQCLACLPDINPSTWSRIPGGSVCDDGDPCTTASTCTPNGFCIGGGDPCPAGQTCQGDGVCVEGTDEDNDGFTVFQGDCNDFNPNINPGAVEACDTIDNNCNGEIDETFDLQFDPNNCGSCGKLCNAGDICISGLCEPPI